MQMSGVKIVEVNSDADINNQLGKDGQLRLDNPYNIFIGGQSLDRGITIDHLIGAFYGRDPKRFQMDTVLQHSRMYGARSSEDLSVTRFSTTNLIYETMKNMHFFDKDLREMLKKGAPIVFIAKLDNKIIPCGPQKTLASNMISFRPGSRLLPIGFQTKCKTTIGKTIDLIEQSINNAPLCEDQNKYLVHKMSISEISDILRKINDTFEYSDRFGNNELGWDIEAHIAALGKTANEKKEVLVYSLKTLKLVSRTRISGFQDAPDDGRTDTPICKNLAKTTPVVMLLKIDGSSKEGKNNKDRGWNGADFYWPVIVLPENSKNYVYTPNSGL